jgi:hypothetical protein
LAPELNYDDFSGKSIVGKVAIMDVGSPDGIHPHSKYLQYHDLRLRLSQLKSAGALAVVLINASEAEAPSQKFKTLSSIGIPVVFVASEKAQKRLLKKEYVVQVVVNQREEQIEATNVLGFIDNGAENTVVFGAHYDHLGMGGEGSRYRGEPAIHNGADDNASGVAGLIELAMYYSKRQGESNSNYLFIAFSAEEMGLLGSNFFTKSGVYPVKNMSFMINMDMIGRLNPGGELAINGTGTAPAFEERATEIPCAEVRVKTSRGGTGPSDHTSFYNVEVPAVHFFTGAHELYHTPDDDPETLNYKGMREVLTYIVNFVNSVQSEGPLEFTPTAQENSSRAPRFTVTLGVVPDYLFDGVGMRIDGVTEGKPASKAGMQKGDVVTQLGEYTIKDMMSYMEALSQHKKGDRVSVTFMRNGGAETVEVQF